MKRMIQQNGRTITSLDELVDDEPVRVWNVYTVEDLNERILIGVNVFVPRETWCEMVRVFAREKKISAVKWVRQVMGWGLKEAKFFVDGLLEESQPARLKAISLTLDDVRNWFAPSSLDRGWKYYREGRIFNQSEDGQGTLTADCLGQNDNVYNVEVSLGASGIVTGYCSCPVRSNGCKHIAALLLTWLYRPDTF